MSGWGQAIEASERAEAAQLAKELRRREVVAWMLGLGLYGSLELVRIVCFPASTEWSLIGWLIPFESLVFLLAYLSATSMQSELAKRGYSNDRSQFEASIYSLLKQKDEEALRLVRGIAVAGAIYAFVLGMVVAGVARTYLFG